MFDNKHSSTLSIRFEEGEQVTYLPTGETIWTVGLCTLVSGRFVYDLHRKGAAVSWAAEEELQRVMPVLPI